MSAPTVLVYLTDESLSNRLIDVARQLVHLERGRLIGAYAGTQLVLYPVGHTLTASAHFEEQSKQQSIAARKNERLFRAATDGDTFPTEWRFLPSTAYPVETVMMGLVRMCDFVVADLLAPSRSVRPFGDVAEALALQGGRPVLLIPEKGRTSANVCKRVMVAWDGSRESARAVFDALPLLRAAQDVHVVCVEESGDSKALRQLPGVDIAETLAHHGIQVTTERLDPAGRSTGEALLDRADALEATMLVMGAYGHARWQEFILGGATRHVLRNTVLPVFVSH